MIHTQLIGGLGNQLFIHACAIGLSKKWGIPYCAPSQTMNPSVWGMYSFPGLTYCEDEAKSVVLWKEPNHGYHEIPFHPNILLSGYFQSYKFFDFCREDILKAFGFDDEITNDDTVAVHIRRNDYLKYPLHHPVVTLEYIRKAAEKIVGDYEFLVFSDDADGWVEKNITEEVFGGREFEIIGQVNTTEDFRYMSMCEKFIISNSTYSYWAAYLSNSSHKQVITPSEKNWFGILNNHLDVSTLLPPDWERIEWEPESNNYRI